MESECIICQGDLKTPPENDEQHEHVQTALECAHTFHTACIYAWWNKSKGTCPICRSPFTIPEAFHDSPTPSPRQLHIPPQFYNLSPSSAVSLPDQRYYNMIQPFALDVEPTPRGSLIQLVASGTQDRYLSGTGAQPGVGPADTRPTWSATVAPRTHRRRAEGRRRRGFWPRG